MIGSRFVFLILVTLCTCLPGRAFQINNQRRQTQPEASVQAAQDELQQHLSAAETYQLSGDLDRAGVENRFVVSIALQRLANLAIRDRDLKRGAEILNEALIANDGSEARTSLALAYLELGELDEGIR